MNGGFRLVDFWWVGAGGFLGTIARYGVALLLRGHVTAFPVATLAVNVAGCAAIGALSAHAERWIGTPWLFLVTGLLGGFTTFSAFGLETFELLRDGRAGAAAAYAALSLGIGLGAVWLGRTLA